MTETRPPPPLKQTLGLTVLLLIPPISIALGIVIPKMDQRIDLERRAEAANGLERIRAGLLEHGATALPRCPGDIPGATAARWSDACVEAYGQVGAAPDPPISFCTYVVVLDDGVGFRATAKCDLDEDRHPAIFEATAVEPPRMVSPPDEV